MTMMTANKDLSEEIKVILNEIVDGNIPSHLNQSQHILRGYIRGRLYVVKHKLNEARSALYDEFDVLYQQFNRDSFDISTQFAYQTVQGRIRSLLQFGSSKEESHSPHPCHCPSWQLFHGDGCTCGGF